MFFSKEYKQEIVTKEDLNKQVDLLDYKKGTLQKKDQSFWLKKSKNKIPAREEGLVRREQPNPYTYNKTDNYKQFVLQTRNQTKQRLRKRKLERLVTQKSCQQKVIDKETEKRFSSSFQHLKKEDVKNLILKNPKTKNLFRSGGDILWHDNARKSKKTIGMLYNSGYMESDNRLMAGLKKKVLKKLSHEKNSRILKRVVHDALVHQNKRRSVSYIDVNRKSHIEPLKSHFRMKTEDNLKNPHSHFYNKMKEKLENEVTTIPKNQDQDQDRTHSLDVHFCFILQRSSVFDRLNVSKKVYDNFTLNISEFKEFDKMVATDVNKMTAHVKNEYTNRVCTRSGSAKRRANFFKKKIFENKGENNSFFRKLGFYDTSDNKQTKRLKAVKHSKER